MVFQIFDFLAPKRVVQSWPKEFDCNFMMEQMQAEHQACYHIVMCIHYQIGLCITYRCTEL